MTVEELAQWRGEGRPHVLVDVRSHEEWDLARLEGSFLLERQGAEWLRNMDRSTVLVFLCHHGIRSWAAALRYRAMGFTTVYNVRGGLDSWSRRVDSTLPRY